MKYRIEGGSLPAAILSLSAGESIFSEVGGRTWMRGPIQTETKALGGAGKALGRIFTGESLFMSVYSAQGESEIAFASSFPGKIVVRELQAGESIICQKNAFLCATSNVNLSTYFRKKIGAGLLGGEGFIMQKLTGPGLVFLEIDGFAPEYTLAPGEELICDTGVVAIMDASCGYDIRQVPGLKNKLFGGEGLFDTVVTGPGKVYLQTMSAASLAQLLSNYFPSSKE